MHRLAVSVGYVTLLLALAARQSVWAPLIWLVIAGNLSWAVAALGVSATQPLGALGHAFTMLHALVVTVCAYLEYKVLGLSPKRRAAQA